MLYEVNTLSTTDEVLSSNTFDNLQDAAEFYSSLDCCKEMIEVDENGDRWELSLS